MLLARLATIYLTPIPKIWKPLHLQLDSVEVWDSATWNLDNSLRLLVTATTDVSDAVHLSGSGEVVAVSRRVGRSVCSPIPCILLKPQSNHDWEFLAKATGIEGSGTAKEVKFSYEIDPEVMVKIADRADGLTLMAEALSQPHASGKYRELVRFFECAFRISYKGVPQPLLQFLEKATLNMGFTRNEIDTWMKLYRDHMMHGNATELPTEREIRGPSMRMEQAAYDVLFNKANWKATDAKREDIWRVTAGSGSQDGTVINVEQGTTFPMTVRLYDGFGHFEVDLSAGLHEIIPDECWAGPSELTE